MTAGALFDISLGDRPRKGHPAETNSADRTMRMSALHQVSRRVCDNEHRMLQFYS